MDVKVLDDHLELLYKSSLWTHDVVLKTSQKRWMIETNDERESGKSVLAAWHDDDDGYTVKEWINFFLSLEFALLDSYYQEIQVYFLLQKYILLTVYLLLFTNSFSETIEIFTLYFFSDYFDYIYVFKTYCCSGITE